MPERDCWFPPLHVRQAADRIPVSEYIEIAGAPHTGAKDLTTGLQAAAGFLGRH